MKNMSNVASSALEELPNVNKEQRVERVNRSRVGKKARNVVGLDFSDVRIFQRNKNYHFGLLKKLAKTIDLISLAQLKNQVVATR